MRAPLLNVDAGELDDEPEELYALADLVHVACGGHAGDETSMARVLASAARSGTRAGAHPSYADRAGFGRVRVEIAPGDLEREIGAQLARLAGVAARERVTLFSVKPHGALYHAAAQDRAVADVVVGATRRVLGDVTVVGPVAGGDALRAAAEAHGLRYLREAFADRGVRPDGSLVPRGEPGALVHDPEVAATRARELARRGDVDTICLHGDTEGALAIARAVRAALGPKS